MEGEKEEKREKEEEERFSSANDEPYGFRRRMNHSYAYGKPGKGVPLVLRGTELFRI